MIYSSVIDQCATPGMRATPSTTRQCIKVSPKVLAVCCSTTALSTHNLILLRSIVGRAALPTNSDLREMQRHGLRPRSHLWTARHNHLKLQDHGFRGHLRLPVTLSSSSFPSLTWCCLTHVIMLPHRRETTCSLDSGSYNETISDQPGAGRILGKVYTLLGNSLENMILKAVIKKRSMGTFVRSESIGDSLRRATYDDEAFHSQPLQSHLTANGSLVTLSECSEGCDSSPSASSFCTSDDPDDHASTSSCRCAFDSSSSYEYTACSQDSSSNETSSNLIGPGRVRGLVYSSLSRSLETRLNRFAAKGGLGPDAIASQIRQILRPPLHENFLARLDHLELKVTFRLMNACTSLLEQATKFSGISPFSLVVPVCFMIIMQVCGRILLIVAYFLIG